MGDCEAGRAHGWSEAQQLCARPTGRQRGDDRADFSRGRGGFHVEPDDRQHLFECRAGCVLVALTVIGAMCVVAAAVMVYGEFRWKSGTTELRGRLEAPRLPTEPKVFDRRELEGLPARGYSGSPRIHVQSRGRSLAVS